MATNSKKLQIEDCREYLSENNFRIRPPSYKEKYPVWPGTIGIEVEMLPLTGPDFTEKVALGPITGTKGLVSSLHKISQKNGWEPKHDVVKTSDGKDLEYTSMIKLEKGDNLTFEPGGQLEHSTIPYPCLSDAARRSRKIQKTLDDSLLEMDSIKLKGIGINPYHSVEELGLQMDKKRYLAMDEYFKSIGEWGQRMMRQTCTVQVCLDFGETEEVMAKRFFVSKLLAPFAQGIFAYSPFIDGKLSEYDGVRAKTWRHIDPSRTGVNQLVLDELSRNPDGFLFNKDKCVDSYLSFLINSNVVFVESAGYKVPSSKVTFGHWLNNDIFGTFPNTADLETQLSLLFPEVRPKGFLELRSPDAQDRAWQFVPAAFYTGLLYDDRSMNKVLSLLAKDADSISSFLDQAEMGLRGESLKKLSIEVMKIALDGFMNLPGCYSEAGTKEALAKYADLFTFRGETPSSVLRKKMVDQGTDKLNEKLWSELSEEWAKESSLC